MDIQEINNFILSKKEYYENLQQEIIKNITGRIPHHKTRVINAVVEKLENMNNYLEIGVHNGASMSYAVSGKKIECYGIDLFDKCVQYKRDKLSLERTEKNIQLNNKNKSAITLIQGDSTNPKTLEKLKNTLGSKDIDLLFIDGNHSYEYVKSDFFLYTELVREGGIIILDDYTPRWPGVYKFANNLKDSRFRKLGVYENNELIMIKEKQ